MPVLKSFQFSHLVFHFFVACLQHLCSWVVLNVFKLRAYFRTQIYTNLSYIYHQKNSNNCPELLESIFERNILRSILSLPRPVQLCGTSIKQLPKQIHEIFKKNPQIFSLREMFAIKHSKSKHQMDGTVQPGAHSEICQVANVEHEARNFVCPWRNFDPHHKLISSVKFLICPSKVIRFNNKNNGYKKQRGGG